jgi:hypothetical protein
MQGVGDHGMQELLHRLRAKLGGPCPSLSRGLPPKPACLSLICADSSSAADGSETVIPFPGLVQIGYRDCGFARRIGRRSIAVADRRKRLYSFVCHALPPMD